MITEVEGEFNQESLDRQHIHNRQFLHMNSNRSDGSTQFLVSWSPCTCSVTLMFSDMWFWHWNHWTWLPLFTIEVRSFLIFSWNALHEVMTCHHKNNFVSMKHLRFLPDFKGDIRQEFVVQVLGMIPSNRMTDFNMSWWSIGFLRCQVVAEAMIMIRLRTRQDKRRGVKTKGNEKLHLQSFLLTVLFLWNYIYFILFKVIKTENTNILPLIFAWNLIYKNRNQSWRRREFFGFIDSFIGSWDECLVINNLLY